MFDARVGNGTTVRRNGVSSHRLRALIAPAAAVAAFAAVAIAPMATPVANADGGDYSITFRAAAPFTYDHATGGGAWNDATVGKNDDIVPQLEGGDFQCGDVVTYLTEIVRGNDNGGHAVETIQIDLSFLADTTGQSGAAMSEVVSVGINYGAVQNGDGPGGIDSGIVDDGGSTATLLSQSLTGPLFTMGSELLGSIEIDDLELGETVILRTDVRLACEPFSNPTGNLQGQLDQATVVFAPSGDVITSAAQTIPFKQIGDLPVATITIVKDAVPASTDLFSFTVDPPIFDVVDNVSISDFDLADTTDDPMAADPTESRSFAVSPNPSLMYTVTEAFPEGWVLTDITCDGATASSVSIPSVDITVEDMDEVTCTFTNTLAGNIIVEKQTDPDGSTQSFAFSTDYGAGFSLSDGQTNDSGPLLPGTYSVSETVPPGWELTSATCDDGSPIGAIDLSGGETVTCTFNNEQDANIIVEKQTDPDGSPQLFDFSTDYGADFQLSDGQTNDSGALDPGTYSVSETVPAGWTQSSATCDDGSDPSSIDLAAGQTVTCTFNNFLQRGNIVVVKQTDPDGSTQSFAFTSDYGAGFSLSDGQSNDSGALLPGTYSVSETVPAGWSLTSATCDDGSDPSSIVLDPNETVTCTFTNTIDRGNIVVVKQTDPDGSTQSFDFTTNYGAGFSLGDGQSNDSGALLPTSEAGTYSVSETVPAGWDLTSATCDDQSPIGAIDLQPGETVTCTFTNTIQRGNIVVVKETDPDGSPQSFDFTTNYGAGFSLTDGQSNDSGPLLPTSEAGTYSVSETVPAGWDLSSATCDDGSPIGAIDLAPGETVTCTFTNQADANIIVIKQTDPDGSSAVFDFTTDYGPGGFTLGDGQSNDSGDLDPGTYSVEETGLPTGWSLSGATCSDGSDPSAVDLQAGETVTCTFNNTIARGTIIVRKVTDPAGSAQLFEFTTSYAGGFSLAHGDSQTTGNLLPSSEGGLYSVAETNVPAGWQLTDATCSDGSDPSTISLDPGETVTCTFTNTIQRGNIIVVKQTDPDGSTQSFDFTTNYGAGFSLSDGQSNDSGPLVPSSEVGTYSVSESVPAGWDLTSATCDDGSDPGAIDLAPNETVTCTFTNQADANIVIVKQTLPDGNNTTFDFTTSYDPGGFTLGDGQSNDSGDLDPGSYTVSETVPAGWQLTDLTCADPSADTDDSGDDAIIELSAGETVTCTFTNTKLGEIRIQKVTNPNTSTQTFDFTATYDADGFTLGHFETNNSGPLLPGSYTVTEQVPAGWDLVRAECDDGFPSTDPSIEPIVLEAGEIVNCVFENTQRGTIAVAKETVPDADPATFGFTGDVTATLGDGQTSTPVEVIPGTYTSTETVPAGWDLTDISCDDNDSTGTTATATFNVQPGEDVVCTFTNTKRGMVELLKLTNGAESQTMAWNFTLTGPDVDESDSSPPTTVDFGGAKLIPGEEYTLCETGIPAGWTLEWQVDTDGDGVADTIIPMVAGVNDDPVGPDGYSRVYDPNYVPPPGQFTNDTRCVNFIVDPGETLNFQIDNQFPGGEPRTIGYWKNWNTCTGGNQPGTAAANGGPDEGWYILDDLLNDPGYTIGILELGGEDCEDAVNILDKRDIVSGKKKASDAAYNLASQLLAAQLNLSAGAETCEAAVDAVNEGQTLLAGIGFDGSGKYLKGKNAGALKAEANALAAVLDQYNNGDLCTS